MSDPPPFTPHPPRLAIALIGAALPREERDELLADLRSEHAERAATDGTAAADRWLWQQALRSAPAVLRWRWRRSLSSYEAPANAYRPGGRMLKHWLSDTRYALRRLRARPSYVIVAVLTLALGIGGTAAVYGVARALLFDPLPYERESEIASFYFAGSWTEQEFLFLRGIYPRAALPGFRQVAAHRHADVTLREGDAPTRLIPGLTSSAELFDVLGARPFMGRTFRAGDDVQGAEPVAVISYGLWKEMGSSAAIVGSRLTLDGTPRTVIGVMPRGFWFPSPDVRVWLARDLDPNGQNGSYTLVGRLAPGADMGAMAPYLERLTRTLDDRFDYPAEWDKTKDAKVTPIREELLGKMRPALIATFVAMGLILLMACANVAALMLGQVEARETELAVRSALGANRRRLTQQLVVEALLLGVGAGLAGAVMAVAGFGVLARALPIGAWGEAATFDWRMFVAALALAVLAVLLVVLVPALSLWRGDLKGALSRLRTGGIQGRGGRLERGLVVVEVALAMLIASGAALLVRSVSNLYAIDPGIETRSVAVIDAIASGALREPERMHSIDETIRALAAIPGVTSAAAAMKIPLRGNGDNMGIEVPGRDNGEQPSTYFRIVTADYFKTLGIAVTAGRTFDISDRPDSAEIAVVVNEALVKKFFPGEEPLGKVVGGGFRLRQRIVGVVENVAEGDLTDDARPTRYYLAGQAPWWGTRATFTLRAASDEDSERVLDEARKTINRVSPAMAIDATTTMARVFDTAVGPARPIMSLLALLSTLALVLGAVGIYGVTAHFAARRKRDWAIRIALGLPAWQVVRNIVSQGTLLVAVGIVVGALGTLALGRLLASFLFGISPLDPVAFAAASVMLLTVGAVSALIPARRAGRVAPASALREQ